MTEKLKDILMLVKWATISTEYFGRTRTWLYQRLSGYMVNGKPAQFTDEEREALRSALKDVARRIDEAADRI